MSFIEIARGDSPLILGIPHSGTEVPEDVAEGLNDTGRALADTDWHIHRLYAGLVPDMTTVRTRIHRYVIDVNRDPEGKSLYPGQNTTTLCPLTDFDGAPIHRDGHVPDEAEVERRKAAYHAPYHAALAAEIERVKARHGFVIIYDCHSIRSEIPFLFDGVLPDLNVGTDQGRTCGPKIEELVLHHSQAADGYSSVLNGRFKGGWTTRHYGRPSEGLHAIQMELAQSTYMKEAPPWTYDTQRAEKTRAVLGAILSQLASLSKEDVS